MLYALGGGFGADGRQVEGSGTSMGLDPNFGGPTASGPGALAGWFNSDPPSLAGQTMTYDSGITGVLIGRFSSTESFSMADSTLSATWNSGIGTPVLQDSFTVSVIPTPGAVALLGLAGLTGRLRRRG